MSTGVERSEALTRMIERRDRYMQVFINSQTIEGNDLLEIHIQLCELQARASRRYNAEGNTRRRMNDLPVDHEPWLPWDTKDICFGYTVHGYPGVIEDYFLAVRSPNGEIVFQWFRNE